MMRLIGTDGSVFSVMANTKDILKEIEEKNEDIFKEAMKKFKEEISKKYISMNYNEILGKCCNILDEYKEYLNKNEEENYEDEEEEDYEDEEEEE